MLRFYGENLPAVEINSTFYRMPREGVLKSWAEQVPPEFRFTLKAPRNITHMKPLLDKGGEVDYLYRTADTLGEKLGAILFQLPPYLQKNIELFVRFVDLLPTGIRSAFEFRHPSWFDSETYRLLRSRGCTLCCSEGKDEAYCPFVSTTDWGYIRLRKSYYTEAALLDWVDKIKRQYWTAVYIFFKHEDKAVGPRLAGRLMEIAARQ
jgi:uncharacterized protein YecE (DUF72 family)